MAVGQGSIFALIMVAGVALRFCNRADGYRIYDADADLEEERDKEVRLSRCFYATGIPNSLPFQIALRQLTKAGLDKSSMKEILDALVGSGRSSDASPTKEKRANAELIQGLLSMDFDKLKSAGRRR